MSAATLRAAEVRRAHPGPPDDTLTLTHADRLIRRRRVVTDGGLAVLVDLPAAIGLDDGDALVAEDGRVVAVRAAAEPLLEARGDLPRLAWHVGNRHAPCELGDGWLRVPADRPMEAMLRALGAEVAHVTAPFRPEGGAYGHAHASGDDHGHGA